MTALDRVSLAITEEDDRWFVRRNKMLSPAADEICRHVDDGREIEVVTTVAAGEGERVMWTLRPKAVARAALSAIAPQSPEIFTAMGYRGLNRTRDTATFADAIVTQYINAILKD